MLWCCQLAGWRKMWYCEEEKCLKLQNRGKKYSFLELYLSQDWNMPCKWIIWKDLEPKNHLHHLVHIYVIVYPYFRIGLIPEGAIGFEEGSSDGPKFDFNPDRPSRLHWSGSQDPKCSQFRTQFLKNGSSPLFIPLASLPGSGNTWTRYLIEGLTGVFTGDVYFVRIVHFKPRIIK